MGTFKINWVPYTELFEPYRAGINTKLSVPIKINGSDLTGCNCATTSYGQQLATSKIKKNGGIQRFAKLGYFPCAHEIARMGAGEYQLKVYGTDVFLQSFGATSGGTNLGKKYLIRFCLSGGGGGGGGSKSSTGGGGGGGGDYSKTLENLNLLIKININNTDMPKIVVGNAVGSSGQYNNGYTGNESNITCATANAAYKKYSFAGGGGGTSGNNGGYGGNSKIGAGGSHSQNGQGVPSVPICYSDDTSFQNVNSEAHSGGSAGASAGGGGASIFGNGGNGNGYGSNGGNGGGTCAGGAGGSWGFLKDSPGGGGGAGLCILYY